MRFTGLAASVAALLIVSGCSTTASEAPPVDDSPETTTSATASVDADSEASGGEVSALELNADGILGGTGYPTEFDAGAPGDVSVVYTGDAQFSSGSIPVVVRNATSETVSNVEIAATIRDAEGTLAGSGSSQGTTPAQIAPGSLALAYVYVEDSVSEGFQAEHTVSFTELSEAFGSGVDLRVDELETTDDGFIGTAVNETDETVSGPISVDVYCFDESGTIIDTKGTYTDQDEAAPGATVSYSVNFRGDPCPAYIVGLSGYSF